MRLSPSCSVSLLVIVGWLSSAISISNLRADSAYVTESGRLIRVSLSDGNRALVTGVTLPACGMIVLDPDTGDIYSADQEDRCVYRVSRTTGDATIISGAGVGTGPSLTARTFGIAFGTDGSLVVVDGVQGLLALVKVDPKSGNRTIFSAGSDTPFRRGAGGGFQNPFGIARESSGDFVITDIGRKAVIRVNRSSGNRLVLSGDAFGDNVGTGPQMEDPYGIAVRLDGAIFVSDKKGRLFQINPVTGERTIAGTINVNLTNYDLTPGPDGSLITPVSSSTVNGVELVGGAVLSRDPMTGKVSYITGVTNDVSYSFAVYNGQPSIQYVRGPGPLFLNPVGVAIDQNGSLIVSDTGLQSMFVTNPRTAERSVLPSSRKGTGPELKSPKGIVVSKDGAPVVVDGSELSRVDPLTGNRSTIAGTGTVLELPKALAIERAGTIVMTDAGASNPKIVRVDLVSGNRTIVSSRSEGVGPKLEAPYGIIVEASGSIVVTDQGVYNFNSFPGVPIPKVIRIDPVTGDRTLVSDSSFEFGLPWSNITGIALLEDGSYAVADPGSSAILRVDRNTGKRSLVSGMGAGEGPSLGFIQDIAQGGKRKLLALSSLPALLEIDIETGNRRIISDASTGSGPLFHNPPEFFAVSIDTAILPSITVEGRNQSGQFQFRIAGASGATYAIERSTNLFNWSAFTNATCTSDGISIIIDPPVPSRSKAFYRAKAQ